MTEHTGKKLCKGLLSDHKKNPSAPTPKNAFIVSLIRNSALMRWTYRALQTDIVEQAVWNHRIYRDYSARYAYRAPV